MHTLLYKAEYSFSEETPFAVKSRMIEEFWKLRHKAVKKLNPNYSKWNAEFGDIDPEADDPYKDYGGIKYCKYIRNKTREVLAKVNKRHPFKSIYLDADDIGDIIAVDKKTGTTLTVELSPVKEINGG